MRTRYGSPGAVIGAVVGVSVPLFWEEIFDSGCESCPYFMFTPIAALLGAIVGGAIGLIANKQDKGANQ